MTIRLQVEEVLTFQMMIYPFNIDLFIKGEVKFITGHILTFDKTWQYLMKQGFRKEELYSYLNNPAEWIIERE